MRADCNGARVTGVNQDCAGQTRLHGHPTYGLLIFLRFTLAFSKCAVCVKHYILFIYFWPLSSLSQVFLVFFFKLYKIVLVLPNIKMNPPQVYMYPPSWTLLPPPSPYHPSGLSQCTSPKHPVSCIEPGLATHFIHDILHVSMPFSQIFPPSCLCFWVS